MPPNVHLCVRSGKTQQKRGRNRPRSGDHSTAPAWSIDSESDDVVAALEVDLDVTARADHDILLAAQRVAGGRRIDARPGAEAATVVNNNAAATLITLAAVATGKEVIVSRGELIEIGGSYRLPEVMSASGAILREVGTTNKTRATDYSAAVGSNTGALLHTISTGGVKRAD